MTERRSGPQPGRLALQAVLWLAFGLTWPAAAAEFSLDALLQQLQGVKSAEARFVEERRLALLDAPLVTEGTLSYEAPDKLIRQDLSPKTALYQIDADSVTVSNDQGEYRLALQDEPLLQASIGPLLAALAGDRTRLERDFTLALSGQPDDWTLTLAPKPAALQEVIAKIALTGQASRIQAVSMDEQDGDQILLRLTYPPP